MRTRKRADEKQFDNTKPDNSMKAVISGKIEDACLRYGYGRTTMQKIAEDAGAIIRYGRSVNVFYPKVDEYLKHLSQ